jgi:tetratricopeptide (TPR) repeat protein
MSQKWLAINPLQPAPHRAAAEAAEHLNDHALAVGSYEALLRLDPVDVAELHVQLAGALEQQGELPQAKRHALLALEETPRFRRGYQRLFSILGKIERETLDDSPPPPPVAEPGDVPQAADSGGPAP